MPCGDTGQPTQEELILCGRELGLVAPLLPEPPLNHSQKSTAHPGPRSAVAHGARRVLCMHGRTEALVRYLRERGIAAENLGSERG